MMINLLELFGVVLILVLGYIIIKEKNYKLLLFGVSLLPFGVVWESLTVGTAWIYTTPPGVSYSIYITSEIPLIIPLGWSFSMMLLFYIGEILKEKTSINQLFLLFLMGTLGGLIFELVFVNLGYWSYLIYPQVANLRPNIPIGWGILTMSLILTFNLLWTRISKDLGKKPYYLLLFFIIYFIIAIPLIAIMRILSVFIMDPLCIATICK